MDQAALTAMAKNAASNPLTWVSGAVLGMLLFFTGGENGGLLGIIGLVGGLVLGAVLGETTGFGKPDDKQAPPAERTRARERGVAPEQEVPGQSKIEEEIRKEAEVEAKKIMEERRQIIDQLKNSPPVDFPERQLVEYSESLTLENGIQIYVDLNRKWIGLRKEGIGNEFDTYESDFTTEPKNGKNFAVITSKDAKKLTELYAREFEQPKVYPDSLVNDNCKFISVKTKNSQLYLGGTFSERENTLAVSRAAYHHIDPPVILNLEKIGDEYRLARGQEDKLVPLEALNQRRVILRKHNPDVVIDGPFRNYTNKNSEFSIALRSKNSPLSKAGSIFLLIENDPMHLHQGRVKQVIIRGKKPIDMPENTLIPLGGTAEHPDIYTQATYDALPGIIEKAAGAIRKELGLASDAPLDDKALNRLPDDPRQKEFDKSLMLDPEQDALAAATQQFRRQRGQPGSGQFLTPAAKKQAQAGSAEIKLA